ncbi:MAG: penicillin acylase family protein, partial [Pirellula sp.]
SLICLALCFGAVAFGVWKIRSTLPRLDGTLRVVGIQREVRIQRDNLGVPSILAQSREDAAYGLGFAHAQDRFFQMDLLRRIPSGRMGELFGQMGLRLDRSFRKHRFEKTSQIVVEAIPENHRRVLDAYAEGVNAGLASLSSVPIEYMALGQTPQSWSPSDSILVMLAMMCDLQPMDAEPEVGLGLLKEKVSDEVFHFLVRNGSKWDAALDDSMLPAPPIPGPEALAHTRHSPTPLNDKGARAISMSLENTPSDQSEPEDMESGATRLETMLGRIHHDFEFRVGSNNWAVGKSVGRDGHAILASDMHLGLRVPATWYRALMNTPTIDGTTRRLIGVTLPGAPVMVEGSNGSVAWGFTNSYGDYGDVIELVRAEGDPESYMTPSGPKKIEKVTERLAYPGGFEDIIVERSIWGPVVAVRDGRKFVHHWIGDDPNAFDLNIIEMESSTSVEQTMGIANRAGMPNQNVMIADADGNIGWTISGRIPKRKSTPPMVPVDWSKDDSDWQGYLAPENHPLVSNPADGRLWTANSRILGQEYLNVG